MNRDEAAIGRSTRRPYHEFVSHSSRDTWVARQIARQIEQSGASTFVDANDIAKGAAFAEVIRQNLLRADELVVRWTPWALESDFVKMEVGGAWTAGTPVVQVLYGLTFGDLSKRPGFPHPLLGLQMVRLDDLDSYLGELAVRITTSVGNQEARDGE